MSRARILDALQALYPHCDHYMSRTADQVTSFFTGYISVLTERFGDPDRNTEVAAWVETVCKGWLGSLQERKGKFPTPDQVRDMAAVYSPHSKSNGPQKWRFLTREEYADLKIWEQERHLRILSNVYRNKAGPMRRDQPLPHFPERWEKYMPMALAVESEAARLQEVMRSMSVRKRQKVQATPGQYTLAEAFEQLPFMVQEAF
jgi:hypothetical protein